jgi:hypothetical protein
MALMFRSSVALALPLMLALAACNSGTDEAEIDKLDAKLGGKADIDPAITRALEDQIMIDPELAGPSGAGTIRPANEPYSSRIPQGEGGTGGPTLGQIAQDQARRSLDKFDGCLLDVDYAMAWSVRLPAELPLPPGAQVNEAAGSNQGQCGLRAVSFTSRDAPRAVAGYYAALARRAGFETTSAREGEGTMLSAWRDSDGAAFYAVIQPGKDGSTVDLVTNRGS